MSGNALELFASANDLWFRSGRTAKALDAYQETVRLNPADPVAWFQLARALQAFSRFDEAKAAILNADLESPRLSSKGKEILSAERASLAIPVSFQITSPVPPSELDADLLEARNTHSAEWLQIADVAEERQMFGLAAYALPRSSSLGVHELDEDEREMRRKAANALNRLHLMRASAEQAPTLEPSSRSRDISTSLPYLAQQLPVPSKLPLIVKVALNPARCALAESVSLEVSILNSTDHPLAVNRRLLLNRPSAPPEFGEIFLSVQGPLEYQNLVLFQVRAGRPNPEDFGLLEPGRKFSRNYLLSKYESLHLIGVYQIWATYHNSTKTHVNGIPVFVGSVSSPAERFERF